MVEIFICIRVSVYNNLWVSNEMLSSLRATLLDLECKLIIVDGGSSDETHEWLKLVSSNEYLKIITNSSNFGHAKSVNIGC